MSDILPFLRFAKYDELVELKDIKNSPHQRNKHPKEQIERLALVMREEGVTHPILVSTLSETILAGHGRRDAAKINGWKSYPVVYVTPMDEDHEWRLCQSDNAIAAWAELDLAALNRDLEIKGPFNLDLLALESFKLEPAEKFINQDLWEGEFQPPEDTWRVNILVRNEHEQKQVIEKLGASKVKRFKEGKIVSIVWADQVDEQN